jgi:predicted enzyme related to lactoylglutathione lyase
MVEQRVGFPSGVPCWIDTGQPDPEGAAAFYGALFGWTFEDRMPPESGRHYFVAQLDGRDVAAIGDTDDPSSPTYWATYFGVDSADETAKRVSDAGGTVLVGPFDVGPAGRMAVCADPAGAVFSLWQAGDHKGAEAVNEAGSWNWSDLVTPDPEGAKTFYGAVFGLQAQTVDFGFGESTMWRLPGYGDFLARFDPDIKARQSGAGAPPGFEDAIGWMSTGDEARWAVTFSVADADAVAGKAVAHGGEVLVPPFDAGPVRSTTIRDPQGAVFTAHVYNPD